MSVMIKGLEMPEKGKCEILIIHSDGSIATNLTKPFEAVPTYKAVPIYKSEIVK